VGRRRSHSVNFSCLLGQTVRYNGGHKRDAFLVETLAATLSGSGGPEVELGMATPREPVRLARQGEEIRMVGTTTQLDHTAAMRAFARRRVVELAADDLCGYVLKKDSPSCGMERVRVYGVSALPSRTGRGLFADALMRRYPTLPVEEEGRLCDPRLRENFVERVFAYRRLRALFAGRWKLGDLVAFNWLSCSPIDRRLSELGRLVAGAKAATRGELRSAMGRGSWGVTGSGDAPPPVMSAAHDRLPSAQLDDASRRRCSCWWRITAGASSRWLSRSR
jgi:uncharacterized protein YbbK (DUF523 family)